MLTVRFTYRTSKIRIIGAGFWRKGKNIYEKENNMDDMIADQVNFLKENGYLKSGDVVVNTGSMPVQEHLPTNMLKITRVL